MKFSLKRKRRLAGLAFFGIVLSAFCIEYLAYYYNASTWPKLNRGGDDEDVVARVLLVADPQIQGEHRENAFFGWLTRWDSDKYLQKNFHLAKHHTSPDVIVFLGDLFDEGSTANDPEYRRYFKRFSTIFDLPTNENPSLIKYVFVPGDNDVGGESIEPVNAVKVQWFGKTFSNLKSITDFSKHGVSVQFLQMNLFIPDEYKNPIGGLDDVIKGTKKPDIRLIVSHVSLLSYVTDSVKQVLDKLEPDLIISAHSHKSSFVSYTKTESDWRKAIMFYHDFLIPGQTSVTTSDAELEKDVLKIERDIRSRDSIQLDLKNSSKYIREIVVPTCSYRMGVPNMGYGAMNLYTNGSVEYTILWLPSRFKQLYLYAIVYILVKMILTPFVFWKVFNFALAKVKQYRLLERLNNNTKLCVLAMSIIFLYFFVTQIFF